MDSISSKAQPRKLIHVLKYWGSGGVEDYISRFTECLKYKQEVSINSDFAFFKKILKEKISSNETLILFHTPTFILSALACKYFNLNYKIILHNEAFGRSSLKDFYFHYIFWIHSLLKSKIIVWSNSIAKSLHSINLDIDVLSIFKRIGEKEIFMNDNAKNIIFCARYDSQKNIPLMLEIAKSLKNINFNIYGDNYPKDFFNSYENITFHGFEPSKEKIYTQNSILLVTSHYEGGPLVALEALSMGIPVVTTHVGIFKDIPQDNFAEVIKIFKSSEEAVLAINELLCLENFHSNLNIKFLNNFVTSPNEALEKIYE